jgi:hypothetical protein
MSNVKTQPLFLLIPYEKLEKVTELLTYYNRLLYPASLLYLNKVIYSDNTNNRFLDKPVISLSKFNR